MVLYPIMARFTGCIVALFVCVLAAGRVFAADEPMLLRVFLKDGTSIVTYGEYSRVDDTVVVSVPVGGTPSEPRLHVVSIPASRVDWDKTERHAASARYQRFVATRAEKDYQQLTESVAAVLGTIAQATDRASALKSAEQARKMLLDWPRTHYGYRQQDVQEIVGVLDSAIARLNGNGPLKPFDSALVTAAEPPREAPPTMPSTRQQLDQLLAIARVSSDPAERVALLRSALALLKTPGVVAAADASRLLRVIEEQINREAVIDQRYSRLGKDLLTRSTKAAAEARISEVQRQLERIPKEDARLGRQRPEMVQALTISVQEQLDKARHLRLLRDQWQSRQAIYREYQRNVGTEMLQLAKARAALESIRSLEGPSHDQLTTMQRTFSGGATRLDRLRVPDYLRSTHELIVGAWRFAEAAAAARLRAVSSGELATAWEASSAAAGALMMLSRAQKEIRTLIEPPKLQ